MFLKMFAKLESKRAVDGPREYSTECLKVMAAAADAERMQKHSPEDRRHLSNVMNLGSSRSDAILEAFLSELHAARLQY